MRRSPLARLGGARRAVVAGLVACVLVGAAGGALASPAASSPAFARAKVGVLGIGNGSHATGRRVDLRTVLAMRIRPAASTVRSGGQTKPASPSVMIQLSTLAPSYTPADLQGWLRRICPNGVVPAGQLVLQDVAANDGTLLTGFLDVVAPFLPGVAVHPCFSRVFVGTVEPQWEGAGNAYVEGVQDPSFVAGYVAESSAVARAFVARYPQVATDWYVSYEANLNALFYPEVAAGYSNLLSSELLARAAVRPNRRVMWSPAFWYPYSAYSLNTAGMAGLTQSLTQLFSTLRGSGGGIQSVDLQDYVAGSSCQPTSNRMTPADAVGWVRYLQGLGVVPEVVVNTEQYAMDCATGGIVAGDPTEVQARESYYRSQGLALGPAFELRYWVRTHS